MGGNGEQVSFGFFFANVEQKPREVLFYAVDILRIQTIRVQQIGKARRLYSRH